MAKQLKIKIKNTQIAKKVNLDHLKSKVTGEKKEEESKKTGEISSDAPPEKEARRIRAKSKSSFGGELEKLEAPVEHEEEGEVEALESLPSQEELLIEEPPKEVLPPSSLSEVLEEPGAPTFAPPSPTKREMLGPTGRHISDLLPTPKKSAPPKEKVLEKGIPKKPPTKEAILPESTKPTTQKAKKSREFKDIKPARREMRPFTPKDRKSFSPSGEEEGGGPWRRRRPQKQTQTFQEETIIRPTELSVRIPISIKDLASQMKLKAAELIQKLFMQGMIVTLNDLLDDDTTIQFLGSELGCNITIDTSEEERMQITSKSALEEIAETDPSLLKTRPPVITFMGHVDHGKTSLIDAIRETNRVAGEAGAITQHIGAFQCHTKVGDLTILDTPGHEAFSAMRARGASTTDIVVLVIAGDEGIREQTKEAIRHAQQAGVTIVVAINKCDKPNFNAENIYRELAEISLLPELWGGTTITIHTSAVTKAGIAELLEMLALQAEVLELKANPTERARGVVLESEMHKGMGSIATVLVQNGTLHLGDALVFDRHYGRIKTMQNDIGKKLESASPSTPVEITGLSGNPAAGDPFIVVKSEKEARSIVSARAVGVQQRALMQKKYSTLDTLMENGGIKKKVLNLILRADVQGSLEALKNSILRIQSEKAEAQIIFMGVGEISESDVELAQASNAVIIGFHTAIESHVDSLVKEHKVTVKLYDVIYHAIDGIKEIMTSLLDKIAEEKENGTALVQATFKASQLGVIAGCIVSEGIIARSNRIRVVRNGEVIWKGKIASLKRSKEDVKEVKKGLECGILLDGYNEAQVGDILQAYEIIYTTQEL